MNEKLAKRFRKACAYTGEAEYIEKPTGRYTIGLNGQLKEQVSIIVKPGTAKACYRDCKKHEQNRSY